MIKNVKCAYCGNEGYNPNVPVGHVIDTCNDEKCLNRSYGVIGFKDGDIQNFHASNLYHVHPEAFLRPMIETINMDSSQIEVNDLIALMLYAYSIHDYGLLQNVISFPEVSDTPEADYYKSKIFFKKLNNHAKGVKHLRLSAEENYAPAMAEYGYILACGLYGVVKNVNVGLEYLIDAADAHETLAGVYLATVYKEGTYKKSAYSDLDHEDWYRYIALGVPMHDSMVHIVLGYFHHAGLGSELNQELALNHFRFAANDDYVVAMGFIVHILYDYYNHEDDQIRQEIMLYASKYLEKSLDKSIPEYARVKNIYEIVQIKH
ncbi:MAG: hypothetical protein KKH92_00350 [Firmicutes bacterium]|nr:hypothetical protein [Bacillota bacterium]